MKMTTFWKPELIDDVSVKVLPIGPAQAVSSKLMDIPRMHVSLSYLTFQGYLSFLWNVGNGVTLAMREEPEFGKGGVFSIMVMDKHRVSNEEMYRLYVQVFEMFDVVLLDEGEFVDVRQFRKRL